MKILAKKYDEFVVNNNIPNKKLNFPELYPNYNPISLVKTKCENIDENTVKLLIDTKGKGNVLIDKEDYDKVKFYKCHINPGGYITMPINNNNFLLHRLIMNATDPTIYIRSYR